MLESSISARRPRAWITVLFVLFALILAACSPAATPEATDEPEPEETEAPAEETEEPEMTDEPEDTEPAEGEEPEGGEETTLSIGWGGAPSTLDPLFASADTEIALLNAVYDYLIDTDAQSQLVPRLATEWDISDDGLVYTLTIADNAAFHSGEALTVDDVIWTLERIRNSGESVADLFAGVDSVEAGEGNTVVITLAEASPDFIFNLTDNRVVILQTDADDIGNTFNGTGPFVVEDFNVEDRVVMSANADYFQGAPGVDILEFVYFGDTEAAANALRGGVIDGILRMENATFLSFVDDPAYTAIDVATNGHDLIRLRADREPGNDPLVQQAFKLATDRQAVFDRVQLGFGAVGQNTPIGPLYGQYYVEQDLPEYDPQGAADLLAEAGYPDGLDMTLVVPNAPGRPALAEVLASQWAEAGINVTIDVQEESVYYGDEGWLEVDLAITPWGSRPIPQLYLDLAYRCDAIWNEAHFCDEELDSLIDTAGTSTDPAEREAAYADIQRILVERGPVIIPYFFAQFGVFGADVQGVEVHPFAGRTNFYTTTVGG